jgi:hypothetical protein
MIGTKASLPASPSSTKAAFRRVWQRFNWCPISWVRTLTSAARSAGRPKPKTAALMTIEVSGSTGAVVVPQSWRVMPRTNSEAPSPAMSSMIVPSGSKMRGLSPSPQRPK